MTKIPNFPSNHVHIQSLDSASTVDAFIERELELNTGYITVTDHGYLGACLETYKKGKANNLKPILGMECYHRDDNCDILISNGIEKDKIKEYYKYGHFTIHALDQEAYHALIKKTSDRDITAELHGSERKPIFDWKDIEELGQYNLTFTSGCLIGIASKHLLADRPDLATKYYERMRSLVKPGNFYADIYPHRCDKNWVNGVFITLENGTKLKYYSGKKVRTTLHEEISVTDLSKAFKAGRNEKLIAVKNYRTWDYTDEALEIVKCEFIQDFITNECRPWAPDGDVQAGANKFILELAQKYGDPVVIADDSHFAHANERFIQEAKLGGMGENFKFYGTYNRKSSEEAFEVFNKYIGMSQKEFEKIVDNNRVWASRFDKFELKYQQSLPSKFYPEDTLGHLKKLIKKHGRMDWDNREMVIRLRDEVELLHNNGTIDLLPYFFVGEEAVEEYSQKGELTGVGRGSSAGVLINYLLDITHLNPLEQELSLERFLTLDRIKSGNMPDIDFDLPSKDRLVNPETGWLSKRFEGHYAPISVNTLLRVKSSIKDVARYKFGEVPYEIEVLCKSIPSTPQGVEDIDFVNGYVAEDGTENEGLLKTHQGLQDYVKKYPDHWELVLKLLGIMRQKGRHASAYIIANQPVDTFIPLMTISGVRTAQYTAESCEQAGAIKYDFLGLNTLTDLSNAIKIIQERSGLKLEDSYILNNKKVPKHRIIPFDGKLYDIWDLPNDQKVFNSICEGETETVFQLNTSGALKWLKEFNYWETEGSDKKLIDSKMDIATFTALDRPGPLDAMVEGNGRQRNMLQEYVARVKGEQSFGNISYMDQSLPETLGVLIMQEQITKIYQDLTECSRADAENFRRLIAKKKVSEVNRVYPIFMEAASKKVGEMEAKAIWDQIQKFAQYGFCKAHAVSYGFTAYACAFLKYHYSIEWWCAVLRNADKNEIAEKFWKYCKNYIQMPDIQHSRETFVIKDNKIIAPLNLLHGVGVGAHSELTTYGPYTDIQDFCNKIAIHKKSRAKIDESTGKTRAGTSALNSGVVNKLIVSGVANSLFPNNLDLISKLEMYQECLAKALEKKRPEKIPEEYRSLNALTVYQHRKSILPMYSEYLVPYLYNLQTHGVIKKEKGNKLLEFSYKPTDIDTIAYISKSMGVSEYIGAVSFVNGQLLRFFTEDVIIDEDEPLTLAVGAYVLDHRKFTYKNKKTGEMVWATEFLLDVDGEVLKVVKWPDRKTKECIIPEGKLNGAIVIALITKRSSKYGFSIDSIQKIQEPLEKAK